MRDKNWKQVIGGRTGLLIIGALITFCIILALDEIIDLPHLLLGTPRTPLNWTEIVIDIILSPFSLA